MAHSSVELISALRQAAKNLRAGAHYAWGSHGSCNCGHLLQVVTRLSKEEIIRHAQTVHGEWTEIAEDYCGISNAPAYLLVSKLEGLGLTPTDIHNLEYLEDRKVLSALPGGFRWLKKNLREDVIVYFETFATMMEEELLSRTLLREGFPTDSPHSNLALGERPPAHSASLSTPLHKKLNRRKVGNYTMANFRQPAED